MPSRRLPANYYAGDDRPAREALAEAQREVEQLKASLARQLEITAAERKAREAADRSREEALRCAARARMP